MLLPTLILAGVFLTVKKRADSKITELHTQEVSVNSVIFEKIMCTWVNYMDILNLLMVRAHGQEHSGSPNKVSHRLGPHLKRSITQNFGMMSKRVMGISFEEV